MNTPVTQLPLLNVLKVDLTTAIVEPKLFAFSPDTLLFGNGNFTGIGIVEICLQFPQSAFLRSGVTCTHNFTGRKCLYLLSTSNEIFPAHRINGAIIHPSATSIFFVNLHHV